MESTVHLYCRKLYGLSKGNPTPPKKESASPVPQQRIYIDMGSSLFRGHAFASFPLSQFFWRGKAAIIPIFMFLFEIPIFHGPGRVPQKREGPRGPERSLRHFISNFLSRSLQLLRLPLCCNPSGSMGKQSLKKCPWQSLCLEFDGTIHSGPPDPFSFG